MSAQEESQTFDLDEVDSEGNVMSDALRTAEALERVKEAGSGLVKRGDYEKALAKYDECLELAKKTAKQCSVEVEAERKAEKTILACYSNKVLCLLKLERFADAKEWCGVGLEKNRQSTRIDLPGRSKLLFRRGLAHAGLVENRAAVDSFVEAIAIEEKLLGVSNKDASLRVTDSKEHRQRVATIKSMKAELAKAKKAAKVEEQQTQKENFGKAKGFLSATSKKTITDSKTIRKDFLDTCMNRILSSIFEKDESEATRKRGFATLLEQLTKKSMHRAKDVESRVRRGMVAGYLNFLLAEYEDPGQDKLEHYLQAARDWFAAWHERTKEIASRTKKVQQKDDAPPEEEEEDDDDDMDEDDVDFLDKDIDEDAAFWAPLGKVCALESAGHAFTRAGRPELARPFLRAYCDAVPGELPAYHNLPDSYLLQRGLPKMDDKARRAFKWKHRAHLNRAVFDAYSSIASCCKEMRERAPALDAAHKGLEKAFDLDAKVVAHNNLAFLYASQWPGYSMTHDDAALGNVHAALSKALEVEQKKQEAADQAEKAKTKTIDAAKGPDDDDDDDDDAGSSSDSGKQQQQPDDDAAASEPPSEKDNDATTTTRRLGRPPKRALAKTRASPPPTKKSTRSRR